MVNDDAGDMSMSGIYPETPNIGHLGVDVGLQRLRGHPLVRGRLVAAAPVLGNLSGNVLILLKAADAEGYADADIAEADAICWLTWSGG